MAFGDSENPRLRKLHRFRLAAGVGTILIPLACAGLLGRQAGRMAGLAERGIAADAVVTAVSRDGGGTYYAYGVDGVEYEWNVARAEAPFEVGTHFPITVLPDVPSFSRPGVDRAAFALQATNTRRLDVGIVLAIVAFGVLVLALLQRDIARAAGGLPPEPVTPEAYRRRLVWTGSVLAVPLIGISAFHTNDALRQGESLVPIAVAILLSGGLVGGMLGAAYRRGPEGAQERAAKVLRWVVPVGALLAAVRLLLELLRG